MRKLVILLAVAAIAIPGVAMAVVLNSMHDIDAYKTVEGNKGGACAYCHVPHGAAGAKLYPTVIEAVPGTRWKEATQKVSLICTQCHDLSATVITSANRTVAPFNDNAHRDDPAVLTGWGDIAALPGDVKVDNAASATPNRIRSRTCAPATSHARRWCCPRRSSAPRPK